MTELVDRHAQERAVDNRHALERPAQRADIRVAAEEKMAIEQIESIFRVRGDDIAAIIIEPIQGEGGDNHFRPEFFRALRQLADQHDVMLIFDEVQTGLGLTGKMWAYEHTGVEPDMIAFGKKAQVCGFMVNARIDQVPDNVFHVASRINSTWGGSLVDMVRCQRLLEIMVEDKLVENAAIVGQLLQHELVMLQLEFPNWLSNARGRGLMCAIDFPSTAIRDLVRRQAFESNPGMIILPCGSRSLRFRPALDVTSEEINQEVSILQQSIVQSWHHS